MQFFQKSIHKIGVHCWVLVAKVLNLWCAPRSESLRPFFISWSIFIQHRTSRPNFNYWLVVWDVFGFSIQLGISSSQLTNRDIFSEGCQLNRQPVIESMKHHHQITIFLMLQSPFSLSFPMVYHMVFLSLTTNQLDFPMVSFGFPIINHQPVRYSFGFPMVSHGLPP